MSRIIARRTYTLAMGACLLVLLFMTISKIAMRPPSFDGGMNLQVSHSLAEGHGLRRTYGERDPFPSEIQTHAPFTIVGAAAYGLFGMGIVQSELANLLYLVLLLCVVFVLIERASGSVALAVTATTFLLCTPGIVRFGSGGYGEIPALFWTVSSLLLLGGKSSKAHIWSAGILIGLGLTTKTATIIASAVFLAGFTFFNLTDKKLTLRKRLINIGVLAVGFATPLVTIEIWRLISLHGITNYLNWWTDQATSISMQAGTTKGFSDTNGLFSKASAHMDRLAAMFSLPAWLAYCWILSPCLLAAFVLHRSQDRKSSFQFCMIAVAAALYFIWWIGITPTQKAWHRRILDGALLLNLSWTYLTAILLRTRNGRKLNVLSSMPVWAFVGLLFVIFFNFAQVRIRKASAPRVDASELRLAVDVLKSLPRESKIYGIGWSSAPVVSLLSERALLDINDIPIGLIDSRQKSFLVVDSATPQSAYMSGLLATYESKALLPSGHIPQIYEVKFSKPIPFSSGAPTAPASVYLKDVNQNSVRGMSGVENGGRWMTSDAFMLIDANPEAAELVLDLYIISINRYTNPAPKIFASLNGCKLTEAEALHEGDNTVTFSIPAKCRVTAGQPATLRLYSNSVIESPITKDDRSLFSVLKRVQLTKQKAD